MRVAKKPASSVMPQRSERMKGLFRTTDSRALSLLTVFILLAAYFHFESNGIFFSPRNVSLLLRQASIVAIAAAGVSILIVMGEVDLSIGSAVYLCSVAAASLQTYYGFGTLATVGATALVGDRARRLAGRLGRRCRHPFFRGHIVRPPRLQGPWLLDEQCTDHCAGHKGVQLSQRGIYS